MFMENYQEYFNYAKMLTGLYATPKELKMVDNVGDVLVRMHRERWKVLTTR